MDYRRVRIRVYQGQSICSVLRGIRFMRESSHGTNLCSRTLKKEKYEGLYIFSPLESTPSRRHGFAIAERYLGGDIYYLFLVPAKQFGIWPIQFCCASGLLLANWKLWPSKQLLLLIMAKERHAMAGLIRGQCMGYLPLVHVRRD